MLGLAGILPSLRRKLTRRLSRPGLTRERVLSGSIRLLDLGLFRVGSEQYAEENESYGLATLRKSHVTSENGGVVFDYPAKSSQRRVHEIRDPQLVKLVRALKARKGGGHELLAYREGSEWVDVRSEQINEHLRELTGAALTAKDFRTWNATVLAAALLAGREDEATSATTRKRIGREVVKEVAEVLGNTPTVARRAYIDPRLFDRFDSGKTIAPALGTVDELETASISGRKRERIEAAVVDLLG